MTTIDLIDVFFRQSIIGIDPIDVFLTIGAHLWSQSFVPSTSYTGTVYIYIPFYTIFIKDNKNNKLETL
jgi:hypothetical protein